MQSYYNVIKKTNVVTQGNKEIVTECNGNFQGDSRDSNDSNTPSNIKGSVESREVISKEMVEDAKKQSDLILSKAYADAQNIENEAYKIGYENGSQQGYKDAYDQALSAANEEATAIINNSNNILFTAKDKYEEYLESKKEEILTLSINMAETVLKRELSYRDGLNEMIYEALNNSRNATTLVIKTSSMYTEEIKSKILYWTESLGLKGEMFVIADETVGFGNAVIVKNNGRIDVGIDAGMESIRRSLF